MAARKLYQCPNTSSCPLGSRKDKGLFSGGISKEQVVLLTGDPDPPTESYGQGVCPNCGTRGTEVEPQGDPREED